MELKLKLMGMFIPKVLQVVTKIELSGKEFDFVYGIDEYSKDYKTLKKQFKRLLECQSQEK